MDRDKIDDEAERLFIATATGQGFINHPAWDDLAEETRHLYREVVLKKKNRVPTKTTMRLDGFCRVYLTDWDIA